MKITAQKSAGKSTQKRVTPNRAQLKVRPGAGNRHRADAFEREADYLAARIVRGETGLGHLVSRTSAAGLQVQGSSGTPLPAGLRDEMELALGANLSAVRIHVGKAADAATVESDAEAMASGRDIYFRSGRYSPYSDAGKHLLAHELVHVLQQTGRVAGEGRVAATNTRGGAAPQLSPCPGADQVTKLGLTFDVLASTHRNDDATVDDDLEAAIKLASSDLGGTLKPTAVAAAAFEASLISSGSRHAGLIKSSPRALAFFFDCAKFIDRWNAALPLLHRDQTLRTFSLIPGTALQVAYTKAYGLDWLTEVTEMNSELAGVWPKKFVQSIRFYAVGPTRAVPAITLSSGSSIEAAAKKAKDEWYNANPNGLAANELHLSAYDTLAQLDRLRIDGLNKIEKEQQAYFSGETEFNPLAVRYYIARGVLVWGKELEANGQPVELVHPFGAEVRALGEKLVEFWTSVMKTAQLSFDKPPEGADPTKASPVIPNDPVLTTELPDALRKATDILFKLTADKEVPTAQVYLAQVQSAAALLSKFLLDKLELALPKLFDAEDQSSKALAYAWFLFRGHEFLHFLKSYELKPDLEFEKKWDGYPDVRFAHRWKVALQIRLWVNLLSGTRPQPWETLYQSASGILENLAQKRSELALLGEYEVDTGAKIDRLKEDFPEGILEFGTISIDEIVVLILSLYNSDLAEKLKILLAKDPAKATDPKEALKQGPILNQAVDQVNAELRPKRWKVKEYVFAENQEEVQGYETEAGIAFVEKSMVSSELIRSHPKSRNAALGQIDKGNYVVFPHEDAGGVFFWAFPMFWRLLETLRADEFGLNTFMAEARFHGALPGPTELAGAAAEVRALDDEEWLQELAKIPEWNLKLPELTKDLYTKSTSDRDIQIRLAVAQERRRLAGIVEEGFKQYTGMADKTWDLPLDLLTYIEEFGEWVIPEEDREPQIAAVFLTIAPTLRKALAEEKRFDIITRYYGYLMLALIFSDGSQVRQLERVVPDEQERTTLLNQRNELIELRKSLDEVRAKVQQRFGFKAEAGKSLSSLVYASTVDPKVAFKIDGVKYELVKVYQTFTYNPAYGYDPGPGAAVGTGGYRPPLLDGKIYGEEYKPSGRKLFTILIDGQRFDITDRDTARLDSFSHVVEVRANVMGLENTKRVIEGAVELGFDLAELVPGAGQALMATRLVATVLQFLASGEFEDIKRMATNEPFELVKKLLAELQLMFTPDKVWEFLLFGSAWIDALMARKPASERAKRVATTGGKKSVFSKIVAGVQSIRRGVGKALSRLHEYLQVPVDSLQASVLARPRLAWAVGLIADQIHHLPELISALQTANKWADFLEGFSAEKAEAELKTRVQDLLNGLANFHLPEKVVPFDALIAGVIDLIIGRFGVKGKAVRIVMDSTGLTSEISGMIAKELEGTGVDPNKVWVDEVLPLFDTKFYEMQTALVAGLYGILTDAPLSLTLERPTATAVKIEKSGEGFVDDEMEEAAPFEGGRPDLQSLASMPTRAPGIRLPGDIRSRAQINYGHDFSHVRLHTSSDAATATKAFGADGLTTGSHVFLRPGLSPRSGVGHRVLNHELAHVLQQTGPRPLGQRHADAPIRGGRSGLSWNPAAEQQADAMARRAGKAQLQGPVPVLRSPLGEWQPSVISIQTVRKLLHKLSDFETAKESQQQIDRSAAGSTSPDLEDTERTKATNIWKAIWGKINDGFKSPPSNFFPSRPNLQSVSTDLKNHLSSHITEINKAVPWLASGSQKITRKKNPDKSVTETKTLKPGAFCKQIENYLLPKTGVSMLIKADDDTGAISGVSLTNLVIVMVGAGGLWDSAFSNAGVTGDTSQLRGTLRGMLRPAGVKGQVTGSDASGNPKSVDIWAKTGFAFSADLIQLAKDHIQAAAIKGRPTDVPPYLKYLATTDKTANLGLRLGRKGDSNQKGSSDRDSHHTTQWLLIEYFRNQTNFSPFPKSELAGWRAAGVAFESTSATRFQHPSDNMKKVGFKELDVGDRGEAMPAIYIAKKTHHEGDLHVKNSTPEDYDDGTKPTQSGTVHDSFRKNLFKGDFSTWKDASDFNAKVQAEPKKFSDQLYTAFQATYADMYHKMEPSLTKALTSIEMTYYLEIAAGQHTLEKGKPEEHLDPLYDPPASKFEDVAGLAKTNNDTIMGASGWVAPY
jgi:Domain of unknown function (DUF4157)